MIVFISDLHLTDGSIGSSISVDAFKLFAQHLEEMAFRASWRVDGVYQPLEEVSLVLLGDIFDPLRSMRWQETNADSPTYLRPWHDPQREDFQGKIGEITEAIIAANAPSLAVLRTIGSGKGLRLPKAAKEEQRNTSAQEFLQIPVRIYYMVGNHDWYYHLPGEKYNEIRQRIIDALGLANRNAPFPHNAEESPELAALFARHQVYARHGDIYDPLNYNADLGRDAASIGDAFVVELIDRFPRYLQAQMGNHLPQAFLNGLRELGNVRSVLLAPAWINSLLTRYIDQKETREDIMAVWDELVDAFLHLDFLRAQDHFWDPFESIDALSAFLKLTKALPLESLNRFILNFRNRFCGLWDHYASHAATEDAFLQKKAKFIIYGHTHHFKIVPLDSALVEGKPYQQMYINSGTWRTTHEITQVNFEANHFATLQLMAYAAFYQGDERKGRRMETWSGTITPRQSR